MITFFFNVTVPSLQCVCSSGCGAEVGVGEYVQSVWEFKPGDLNRLGKHCPTELYPKTLSRLCPCVV